MECVCVCVYANMHITYAFIDSNKLRTTLIIDKQFGHSARQGATICLMCHRTARLCAFSFGVGSAVAALPSVASAVPMGRRTGQTLYK